MTKTKETTRTNNSKTKVQEISLAAINLDAETQSRASMNIDIVHEYSDAMREGKIFPPVDLFFDGREYWIGDGFFRVKAAIKAELRSIRANVYQGTKEDAILFSLSANAAHGERRVQADKKKVVLKALSHPVWCRWSDKVIAEKCCVSSAMVKKYRENSPGIAGHDVDIRIDRDGDLFTKTNGAAESSTIATGEPEPRFSLPPVALGKSELHEKYAATLARKLRKADTGLRRNVDCQFGTAEIVGSKRFYFFATAHNRTTMFAAIGKALVMKTCEPFVGLDPIVVGLFNSSLKPLIDRAEAIGVLIMNPDAVARETEV